MSGLEHGIRTALRERRVALGVSQEELGARIGVDGSQVAQWELGTRTPRLVSLAAWVEALDCAVVVVVAGPAAAPERAGGSKNARPSLHPCRPDFSRHSRRA